MRLVDAAQPPSMGHRQRPVSEKTGETIGAEGFAATGDIERRAIPRQCGGEMRAAMHSTRKSSCGNPTFPFIYKESAESAEELARCVKHTSKYRNIHSGADNEELVSVRQWLRNVIVFLLDSGRRYVREIGEEELRSLWSGR